MGDQLDSSGDGRKPPKLPISGKRNILITSALPYVNNVPHLGNIIGCVLSADVFARYCRLRGYNAIYMCGTDEYGTATETKALEENCTPKEICDKYHAIHRDVYKWFNISFDEFGRTSTPQQTEVCQAIFKKLMENNWLSENTMQQFLADRLVEGTCPTPGCNYDSARGDQCENCGKLLNPTNSLILDARVSISAAAKHPNCNDVLVCATSPRIRDTNHLFLELPLLEGKLREYISSMSVAGSWSQNAIQATNAWLKEGLRQRCITRDLKWGVPVPHERFKDKVRKSEVACLSITPTLYKWWKNPENVELYQFMGKDNVPFHTFETILPGNVPLYLLGTAENWTLMKTISVTEYLNYEAGKFSKSKGVGVFGNDAKDTNIPVEVWRYYLLTNRPEVSDTLFTWADLQAKLNSELLNNLGNFINRLQSIAASESGKGSGYNSIIPDAPGASTFYVEAMEKVMLTTEDTSTLPVKLKQGLKIAMSISSEGNAYLQESQFWKLYKEDLASCSIVMKTSVGVVYLLACLLEPFMPSFSTEVLKQLSLPLELSLSDEKGDVGKAKRPWEIIPAGHRIGTPVPLFKELKDEEVEFFRAKFAGSQADRADRAVKAEAEANKLAEELKNTKLSDKSKKRERSTKSAAEAKPKAAAVEQEITINRLDIRVGLITKVQKHPDADSLYVEEIDVGEAQPRTVVSGLVKFVPLEEMQNRKVCVLCNLKPATMRGIKSQAMVLCASTSDHAKVELVDPPPSAIIGERVTFPGFTGEPDAVLNPKKKVWETLQVDLHTDNGLVACYKDLPFTTSAEKSDFVLGILEWIRFASDWLISADFNYDQSIMSSLPVIEQDVGLAAENFL
ncbi:hypothetical protein OSB04_010192 [Centaurea solstitialis]|uniref:methionine--tRNA ligase n=1 Tax=Centaurea solstitialis TaxID=347529 RepID=A0AA38TRW6_9ASTR|nr:hypothetical protein OSB04_010192 [Centaurea solstitialis]